MAAAAERGAELPAEPPRGVRPPLAPEEVAKRLESTRRELSNRRKILLRNLPAESSSQEIHDLYKDYEIKYCYVDRNKRTGGEPKGKWILKCLGRARAHGNVFHPAQPQLSRRACPGEIL